MFMFAKGDITKKGSLDRVGDFQGVGQTGGDTLLFEGFESGTLRFANYHQTYNARGQLTGVDRTKQY